MIKRAPLTFNTDKIVPAIIDTEQKKVFKNKQTDKQKTTQTSKQVNEQTRNSRVGRQFIAAHIMPEAAKQFKILALQKDMTTQDLLVEAINDLFAKHKLSRIA